MLRRTRVVNDGEEVTGRFVMIAKPQKLRLEFRDADALGADLGFLNLWLQVRISVTKSSPSSLRGT